MFYDWIEILNTRITNVLLLCHNLTLTNRYLCGWETQPVLPSHTTTQQAEHTVVKAMHHLDSRSTVFCMEIPVLTQGRQFKKLVRLQKIKIAVSLF